jgi:Tol biopolymer transport system component
VQAVIRSNTRVAISVGVLRDYNYCTPISSGKNYAVIAVPLQQTHPGRPPRLWRVCYVLTTLQLAAWAGSKTASAQTVTEVQVTPETMTLGVGQKQPLFATAFDQRGNLIPTAKFTFWSSDSLIAQVRKDGTVVGVKPGLAKIEARVQGKRASVAVLITGGAPADPPSRSSSATVLTLDPAAVSLFPGETTHVAAQGLREDGSPGSLGRVTIKSLKPEIARVDTGGLIIAVAPGKTILQAASGSLMATLPVEVAQVDFALVPSRLSLAPGEVDTIKVSVPSQGDREIRGLVQWRSTDTSVAVVSSAGIVRARAAGDAEIVATGFAQEHRTQVAVHRVADAMVVSPPHALPVVVPVRATRQFTAVAETADSTPINEARVSWELGDSSIAAFDRATGVLTAKAVGTTSLTARLPGITPAVWTVQVTPGDIAVEPSRVTLLVAQRATFAALAKEPGSSGSKAAAARWSSDRPDVAQVRENGLVEALTPGHAVITATMPWGKKATADVYVLGDLTLSSNRSGTIGVYQMRVPGPATLIPILVDNASNVQAALAPDRTRIAFSSNRSGNFDLYVMDPDGQNVRRLTSGPTNEGEPAWTPDGTRIVYTVTSGTNTQVASVGADGSENRQLTTASGGNHSPSVSPDGRSIAFVSARDGNHALYTMNLDGSGQRRLTKGSARETSPKYARNGDLFYVVERGGSSKGSKILRMAGGGGTTSQVLQTDDPIASLAISRDGERLMYVISRAREAGSGRVETALYLLSLGKGSPPPVPIPLQPGEQVLTPSF